MRKTTLTILLIASVAATWAQRFDYLPKNASLTCEAVRAYQSGDCETAYPLFCAADSIETVAYYFDLLKYHSCAERIGDSAKAKKLLYRLVQSNGFEREALDTWLKGYDLRARSYWPELDSLIQITENRRSRPFIDSLAAMVRKDQGVRMRIEAEDWNEEIRDQMIAVDSANTAGLQALVAQYGFPSWKLVGQKGTENAWLIAQHSFFYLPEYLKRYRQAVLENDAERRFLAYMEDRYLMMQGRPQIYGTQMAGMGDTMRGTDTSRNLFHKRRQPCRKRITRPFLNGCSNRSTWATTTFSIMPNCMTMSITGFLANPTMDRNSSSLMSRCMIRNG